MIKIHLSAILGKYRMTQAELARKSGIRPATICDISELLEYQPNKIKKTGKNLIVEQNGHRKMNKK